MRIESKIRKKQPLTNVGWDKNSGIPMPIFLFNAAVGPVDLMTGNNLNVLAGSPTIHDTEKGRGYKVWEGRTFTRYVPSSSLRAMLAIFYVNNPATNGVIVCNSYSTTGSQLRVNSGYLQFRPPSTGSPYISTNTALEAGKTYVAFGYCTGTGTTQRHIWINGKNDDGSTATSGSSGACDYVRIGQNSFSSQLIPDVTLIMAATWSGELFDENFARFISNNPWAVFEKQKEFVFKATAGLSNVQNDSSLLWNVRNNVSQDSTNVWNVRKNVQNDSSLSWNSRANVTNDINFAWHILAGVSKDYEIEWDQAGYVLANSNLLWNLRQNVQNNLGIQYNVLNAVLNDIDVNWNLKANVTNNLAVIWSLAGKVTTDISFLYNLRNFVQADSTSRWNVLNSVLQNASLSWDIRASVASDLIIIWNFIGPVIKDLGLVWNQAGKVEQNLSLNYNITNSIQNNLALEWRVINVVENTITMRWNVVSDLEYVEIPTGTVTFVIDEYKITFE